MISGGVSRRALAGEISLLGQTPDEIVQAARAQGPERFAGRLEGLAPAILKLAELHLAYPVLDYFHSPEPRLALPLRLASLHEALLILEVEDAGQATATRNDAAVLAAIELYVARLGGSLPPSEDVAQWQGSPTRARLGAMVERDGWRWRDVLEAPAAP